MNDTLICDELCELDLDVRSTDEFFEVMSKKAKDLGYVTEQFLSAIKKREQDYPTALPVKPYPVAIPHSDPINIVKQFIAPVRLKNAISWCEMANNDSILSVQIVFLLGFKREEGHVEILQLLLQNFQNEDTMESLLKAATKEEFLEIVKQKESLLVGMGLQPLKQWLFVSIACWKKRTSPMSGWRQ